MNRKTRSKLRDIVSALNTIIDRISDLIYEEENKVNSVPENLQSGERYEAMSDAVDSMNDAVSDLECVCESLEELI